jgi:selenocysteine lyase/cysteine desulfurase
VLRSAGLERWGASGSGIVTVRAPDAPGLHARLAARGVTTSLRGGMLRVSAHAHTTDADIERLARALHP